MVQWGGCLSDTIQFEPVNSGRAVEEIVLQIQAAIVNKQIKPGESLPSERDLQQRFKTGRGVIREALQVLRQKGMIEIRKGARGGNYIKAIDVAHVSESLALFLRQNQVDVGHIISYRECMDREIAPLAIIHGGTEEKQCLLDQAQLLLKHSQDVTKTYHSLGELDRELNILFAQLAHNPVFEWMMRAIQAGFSSQDYALYSHADFREITAENWLLTARTIQQGQLSQCLGHIGRHYLLLRQCVSQRPSSTHVSPWLQQE